MTSRRGFTLREMMVAILIFGVAIGLLVPAIQTARINSRRMQCSSNIKNIGLGLQGYISTRNYYPNAGTFREMPGTISPASSVIRGCFTDVTGVAFNPGQGAPPAGVPECGPLYSWAVVILPYIDQNDFGDEWDRDRIFASNHAVTSTRVTKDPASPTATSTSSNLGIGSLSVNIFTCPEDTTVQPGQGNLSYVVNGGFSRWIGDPTIGWTGTASGGFSTRTGPNWGIDVAAQTGVMFLGTDTGDKPWDRRTTPASIVDGASQTILASENLRAGYSPGSPATSGLPTNWACPHPNVVMFVASDKVCPGGRCPTRQGSSDLPSDPNAWAPANSPTNNRFESINSGARYAVVEGASPYPSSGHAGGVNVLFCDGSVRFIKDTIDGSVYASLITPAGSALPAPYWAPHLTHCEF